MNTKNEGVERKYSVKCIENKNDVLQMYVYVSRNQAVPTCSDDDRDACSAYLIKKTNK